MELDRADEAEKKLAELLKLEDDAELLRSPGTEDAVGLGIGRGADEELEE